MPFTGPDDPDLPDNIKALPESKRAQWASIWNSSFASCKTDGGSDSKCEGEAFRKANGVVKVASSYHQLFAGRDSARGRSFVAFLEPPLSINVLPKPGSYDHPLYGTIEITPKVNLEFVTNFNQHVYQKDIPIDAEHETKLSGALGYMRDLRVIGDGSVEARVEWNERGRELLRDDRFHYISPEWFEEWTDPATQQTFKHVLVGAALTVRPFFKEAALRPLVANDEGLWDVDPTSNLQPNDAATWTFLEPDARSAFDLPKGTSADDLTERVRAAFVEEFPGLKGEHGVWVAALYEDTVVVQPGDGGYYEVGFAIDGGGNVSFSGQPKEVVRNTTFAPKQAGQPDPADVHVNKLQAAVWTAKFINDLPDSAFAVTRAGGKKAGGRTEPRNLRMLPHHAADSSDVLGEVDIPHLKAALERVAQPRAKFTAAEREQAARHLTRHAKSKEVAASASDLEPLVAAVKTFLHKQRRQSMQKTEATEELEEYVATEAGKGWFKSVLEGLGFKAAESKSSEDDDDADDAGDKGGDGDGDNSDATGDADNKGGDQTEGMKQMTERLTNAEKTLVDAQATIKTLTESNRSAKFREIVLGRDEPSVRQFKEGGGKVKEPRPMVGAHAEIVETMTIIADAKGEDSAQFRAFVAQHREHAQQLQEAGVFKEVGVDSHGEPAGGGDPLQAAEAKITEYRAADEKLTRTAAITKLGMEEPKLYSDFDKAVKSERTKA